MPHKKRTYPNSFKLVLLAGVVLSLISSYFLHTQEIKRLTLEFNKNSQQLFNQLEVQTNIYNGEVNSLTSLFSASDSVDPDEFETFTQPMLEHRQHKVSHTFFAPYVRRDELPAYLAAQRQRLNDPAFTITPVTDAKAHLPMTYTNPSVGKLGYDIYYPKLSYHLDVHRALDSGELVQTSAHALVKDTLAGSTARDSMVIAKAVYSAADGGTPSADRLLGLVGIVYNIEEFFAPLFSNSQNNTLALRLVDLGLSGGERHADSSRQDYTFYDSESSRPGFWIDSPRHQRFILDIGGRLWGMDIAPCKDLALSVNLQVVLSPFVLLLLLTLFLTVFVWRLSREHSSALALAYHRADVDELTGILSREKIQRELKSRLSQAQDNHTRLQQKQKQEQKQQQLAILFIDLDHFKKINDTLGHNEGDRLLQVVAKRLNNGLRENQQLGRLGGDEFLMIIEDNIIEGNSDSGEDFKQQVTNHCQTLIDKLAIPCQLSHRSLSIGCSIGVAFYPSAGTSADDLIKHADLAMYQAKNAGRSTYQTYTDSVGQRFNQHVEIENQLRKAINNNELTMVYQPKIDISSQTLVGFEALVRWHNDVLGRVPPDQFIPVAEDSGQIVELGEWILAATCEQMNNWRQAGLPVPKVSINISPGQLRRDDFIVKLSSILYRYQIPGPMLDFELTETLLVEDSDSCLTLLNDVKQLGISLSLDDFGTGYSSLSYLKRFPFDSVKIDRSFINDLTNDNNDVVLTQAIIKMGHALGMEVVAEGVEDQQQLALLAANGCNTAQGYYFSPPLSADKIPAMLVSEKTNQVSNL